MEYIKRLLFWWYWFKNKVIFIVNSVSGCCIKILDVVDVDGKWNNKGGK